MKKVFRCFYDYLNIDQLKKIWKESDTLFVFDTNTLLDLYSFRSTSQEEFFNYLTKVKDQTWMPYHVGLEFHNNRIKVIDINENKLKKVDFSISNICKLDLSKKEELLKIYKKSEYPEIYEILKNFDNDIEVLYKPIQQFLEEKNKLIKAILEVPENFKTSYFAHEDKILTHLNDIYQEDNIGRNLYDTQEKIEELWEEAQLRWKDKIPPGYKDYDRKKDGVFKHSSLKYYNALGDLIIFREIKNYVNNNSNIKRVIFVSNDEKEDWIMESSKHPEGSLGARIELRDEMLQASNYIEFFEIINSSLFLDISSELHGKPLSNQIKQDIEIAKNYYTEEEISELKENLPLYVKSYKDYLDQENEKLSIEESEKDAIDSKNISVFLSSNNMAASRARNLTNKASKFLTRIESARNKLEQVQEQLHILSYMMKNSEEMNEQQESRIMKEYFDTCIELEVAKARLNEYEHEYKVWRKSTMESKSY